MPFLSETSAANLDARTAPKAVRDALDAYREAASDLRAIQKDLYAHGGEAETRTWLENEAKAQDAKLLADAIRAGQPDPGTPTLDALRGRLADLERQHAARQLLAQQALAAANRAIREHAETWRASEGKIVKSQRQTISNLIRDLSTALVELNRAEGLRARLERDVLELEPYERSPTGSSVKWASQRIGPGDYLNPSVLVDLLGQLAAEPERPAPPKQVTGPLRFVGRETDLADVAATLR